LADRTRDEVIEATLKAACIRAAATISAPHMPHAGDNVRNDAVDVVSFAKVIYAEATRGKWQRGDDGEGATAGASGPIVIGPGGTGTAASVQIT